MVGEYKQPGDRLRYKNTAAEVLPAKTMVVFGDLVGVTLNDIQPGNEGPVQLNGVWAYQGNLAGAVARGTKVYFDPAANTIVDDATGGGVPAGIMARDEAAGIGPVEVLLNASWA